MAQARRPRNEKTFCPDLDRATTQFTLDCDSIGDQGVSLIDSLQMEVATELCEALKDTEDIQHPGQIHVPRRGI